MFDGRCYTLLFIARRDDNAKTGEFGAGGLGWHFEIKAISDSNLRVSSRKRKPPVGTRSRAIREFVWALRQRRRRRASRTFVCKIRGGLGAPPPRVPATPSTPAILNSSRRDPQSLPVWKRAIDSV